jgi:hypothetical protein
MKSAEIFRIIVLVVVSSCTAVFAQEGKPVLNGSEKAAPPTLNEAEKKFKELLTNVTLEGRWCSVKDGEMGPEKQDKYTIVSVGKVKSDSWIINSLMKYGDKEIVAPIPVEVKWAGDTPVIVVEKMTIPNGGTYSARVLFYGKTYAGSWTGGDHGGLLNGVIVPKPN